MTAGLRLGAPGIYRSPYRAEPSFQPVRLDVAGFVGAAPRGPVHVPVPVTSWSDYQRAFGGFEGRGRLPYAVQAFFAQGGVKAYVLRVAPPADPGLDPTARYRLTFGGGAVVELAAHNEGAWGDRLSISVGFDASQRFHGTATVAGLELPPGLALPVGSLLAVSNGFRWVLAVDGKVAVLDHPLPATGGLDVAVVTATVAITDEDPAYARQESFPGLGLRPEHPRFVQSELAANSLLVVPVGDWSVPLLPTDPLPVALAHHGADRWDGIGYSSFFDDGPADNDPLDEQRHRGVDAMGRVSEIGLLTVPDLYWSWGTEDPVVDPPQRPKGTGQFEPCSPDPVEVSYLRPAGLELLLDGRNPDDLAEILRRQARLVTVAELRRRFVALLDAPARLPVGGILRWRSNFDSSYAAAYHPWLSVPRPGRPLAPVPPSAFAAGIIAAREVRLGLPWGPANEIAADAVEVTDQVSDAEHDRLHLAGVNVFRAERDGFRLTAARTLSSDPDYRQLSVRRLMTMLALTIDRQAQWLVFEPDTPNLRDQVWQMLTQLLRGLRGQGAFAGNSEQEAFFVHCDDGLNPASSQALGRIVAEVGVAPAAPLEYLVLRIAQDADGTLQVEAGNG